MSRQFSIGDFDSGRARTLVIAEIGVNHDGSFSRAMELLRAAAAAGADAVKLQIFQADRLMHGSSAFAEYQQSRVSDATPADMLRRFELSEKAVTELTAAARRMGLLPLATPFSPGDLPLIDALDLPAVKIASPDLVNKPLLRAAAALGRPLLISTGAATMDEVDAAVGWLNEWKTPFALLHCVSSYPAPAAWANLSWIGELRGRFGVPVGYSDHTTEPLAAALAVAAGAQIIEKHLTYNRRAVGPDHAASFDPTQFAEYVWAIRHAEEMLGEPGKRVLEIEQDVRRVSRQSLVLTRSIAAGEAIAESDLTVQRPGTGVPAAQFDEFLGRRAARPLRSGEMISWDMVA
ncbi:MAG TPA: N-acetylneuraminate synthase family protein [Tepidisphaeraceae bacterium]|nr:N-acetylneuraminate synthase family protein [Tepidisphaeraceae bacterium]